MTQYTVLQETDIQSRNSKSKLTRTGSNQHKGDTSFKTVGAVLKSKIPPKALSEAQIPEGLKVTVAEISGEFGEKRNFRSNLTHVIRIIQASDKNPESFTAYLYEARSIAKQQGNVKKKMPYFFRVLEDICGAKR